MRLCCSVDDRKEKRAWTNQEDDKLMHYINVHGDQGCWTTLPKAAGLERCGKSCKMRWMNYLRPDIKRGNFCLQEDDLIIKLLALLGNRWSLIAGRLPGRTANEVKNYWNSHIKRKLTNMGIDPNNHRINQTLNIHDSHRNPQMNNNIISAGKNPLDKLGAESSNINKEDEAVLSLARDDHLINLDLTIAFQPPPRINDDTKKKQVLQ